MGHGLAGRQVDDRGNESGDDAGKRGKDADAELQHGAVELQHGALQSVEVSVESLVGPPVPPDLNDDRGIGGNVLSVTC